MQEFYLKIYIFSVEMHSIFIYIIIFLIYKINVVQYMTQQPMLV